MPSRSSPSLGLGRYPTIIDKNQTQPCEICQEPTTPLFQVNGHWIVSCTTCGHRAAEIDLPPDHVEKTYDDLYFNGGAAGYSDYFAERTLLRNRGRWYGKLLRKFTVPGTVLDIGTAAGFILQGLQDCGWSGSGIEPNPNLAAFARTELKVAVEATPLETFKPGGSFDLVTMIQVIAHFVDLRQALRVTADATHPGSFLLIETWNWRSLTARLFGKAWHEYSPPSVLRWFSPTELEALAAQFDFQKVAVGRPSKFIAGSHAKSLLNYKFRQWPFGSVFTTLTGLIPDKLEIPYPAEDLFWMLLKKGDV